MQVTTALNLNMALAMQGPTQCGKFETVNALAKLLGRLVIVFCCNQTTKIATFTAALQGYRSDYIINNTVHFHLICSNRQNGRVWYLQGLFKFALQHDARNIVQSCKVFKCKITKPHKCSISPARVAYKSRYSYFSVHTKS